MSPFLSCHIVHHISVEGVGFEPCLVEGEGLGALELVDEGCAVRRSLTASTERSLTAAVWREGCCGALCLEGASALVCGLFVGECGLYDPSKSPFIGVFRGEFRHVRMALVNRNARFALGDARVEFVGDGERVSLVQALSRGGVVGPFAERDGYGLGAFGERSNDPTIKTKNMV